MHTNDNTVSMEKVAISLTHRCNLKCKLCGASIPYLKDVFHPAYSDLIADIDRLFSMVDNIAVFNLAGGEPLLRKDLPDICRHVHEKYASQISERLRISTNGTIVPSDELLEAVKLFGEKAVIAVSYYSPEASRNAFEAREKIKAANIECEFHDYYVNPYFGGWVDYGDYSKKHSYEEALELYSKCVQHTKNLCWLYEKGKLYICTRTKLCFSNNITPPNPKEYVDLNDAAHTKEEIKAQIMALKELPFLSACMYCNGMHEKSERFTAGEQIEGEAERYLRAQW